MNCFTHALPFLDRPYFAVGTCIPDWLGIADRKSRVRENHAARFVDSDDPVVAEVAQGIVQHHRDDHWFHQTTAFSEMSMDFAERIKAIYDGERGFRPGLFGHIAIELLLDSFLHRQHPGKLEYFYQQVNQVDPMRVEAAVNQMAVRPTERLAVEIERFKRVRYLFDYEDDGRMVYRFNKILGAIKLKPFDQEILRFTPYAREMTYRRASDLLSKYPVAIATRET